MREYEVEGTSYEPRGAIRGLTPQTVLGGGLNTLASICVMCNDAEISYNEEEKAYTRVGEPTEAALKVLVEKIGLPETPQPTTPAQSASYYGDMRASSGRS